jgi:hypothetical protein
LQHKVSVSNSNKSACGYDMQPWSRHYMRERIEQIICKNQACYAG